MARVLIVGAGIAGDTLATLLARDGWDTTVVELAPALRTGGQAVDLRGDSRQVLVDLGLLEEALEHLVPQRGIAWIRGDGTAMARMPVEAFDGRGLISREELLRSDLAAVLHTAARTAGAQHRFTDTVEELTETTDGVHVSFRSGGREVFDLVVGADGAHSRTRSLHFGPGQLYRRPLGLAHAWFTLREEPGTPDLHGWALAYNEPGRRGLTARPGHAGEQEIGMTFAASEVPRERVAQLDLLQESFAGARWRAQEFLTAARTAPDFALDTYDQIHMDEPWSRGRVVLVGDAAWCASPLSGLGTALGLRGASDLADALRRHDTTASPTAQRLSAALSTYEATMRPTALAAQKLLPGRVAMVAPSTRAGIWTNAQAMRAVQAPVLLPLIELLALGRGHDDTTTTTARHVAA